MCDVNARCYGWHYFARNRVIERKVYWKCHYCNLRVPKVTRDIQHTPCNGFLYIDERYMLPVEIMKILETKKGV